MNYKCVTHIQRIRDYLSGADIVAFDFETAPNKPYRNTDKAALDAHMAHIVGVSFSTSEGDGIYVPIDHRHDVNADKDAVLQFLAEFAADTRIIKVAHNIAFEAMFLYSLGIVLQPPCYDTLAAAQLIPSCETRFRTLSESGLKTLATELLGADMTTFGELTAGRHFDELNPTDDSTIRYACSDSDYTLRLYHRFNGWFDNYLPKHRFITEQVESPTSVYVGIMKYNGLPVNEPLMREKQSEAADKLARLREDISFITGEVNIGANASTAAFKKYLYKDLDLPIFKTTAKSSVAVDDETLILLSEWCAENRPELTELFSLVQEYRKLSKVKSTYIDGYLSHINPATGRIHPDMFPLGTETGRFASRNPNCQNAPRPDEDNIGVRRFISAPEGKVLLSLDLSQIELRVGAFYCRDSGMLETYRLGGDIHAQTTSVIYQIPFKQAVDKNAPHYKERRAIAKNCNFGVFFGLFAKGLQCNLKFKAGLNTPLYECERIIRSLKSGYPMLAYWQRHTVNRASVLRYTETWLGRRRFLPCITSPDWNKKSFAQRCALNTPIQGTAADLLKLAMGRIVTGLPGRPWLKPLLQIHDEVLFEVPEERVQEVAAFIKNCMESQPFPDFDVPVIAEASVGLNYGEMRELKI